MLIDPVRHNILLRTTSTRVPVFGGLRTCGGLMKEWSSHHANEASNLSDLVIHFKLNY